MIRRRGSWRHYSVMTSRLARATACLQKRSTGRVEALHLLQERIIYTYLYSVDAVRSRNIVCTFLFIRNASTQEWKRVIQYMLVLFEDG